ncbi:MAG: hypothetical protein HW403_590 [Dehalococcoidia bacterium]|nr:hypothetical protein [Dehalococcoidia bacterium]
MLRNRGLLVFLCLFTALVSTDAVRNASTARAVTPGIAYGVNASWDRLDDVKAMGFTWIKYLASWKELEPSRGDYRFSNLDFTINKAVSNGFNILVRVDDPPDWASSAPGARNAPPVNNADLGNFMFALAAYLKGRAQAYEIWNEPNLYYEWGGLDPDPVRYGEMLKAAYPRIKAADSSAVVVSGGLSTAGGATSGPVMGDLYFLAKLFDPNQDRNPSDGYAAYLDAVGSHPYGGSYSYDTPASVAEFALGLYFRRAEQQRQMMEVWGQVDKPVWATEFGWIVDPAEEGHSCDLGYFNQMKVSSSAQSANLVGSYQYAAANWPWMGPMFMFNFDFGADTFRDTCDQVRFYSIIRSSGSYRSAFEALKNMPKVGASSTLPIPSSPGNGSLLPTLGPTLRWKVPSGAKQVHLQVNPANNDGAGVNLIIGSAAESFTIPAPPAWYGMLPGMSYSWRVRTSPSTTSIGSDHPSWSAWSETWTFRMPPPRIDTVSLVSPVDGGVVSTTTPTVVWSNSDPSIFYYEVQLSKDSSFNTDPATATASVYWEMRHGGVTVPPNSYSVSTSSRLEPGATYYWRVRPRVQGDGTAIEWSRARRFMTP